MRHLARNRIRLLSGLAALALLPACPSPQLTPMNCAALLKVAKYVLLVDDIEMGRFEQVVMNGDFLRLKRGAFYPRRFVSDWRDYNSVPREVYEAHDLRLVPIDTRGNRLASGQIVALDTRILDVTGNPTAQDPGCLAFSEITFQSPAALRRR